MNRDRTRELEAKIQRLQQERDAYREAAFRSEKLASLGCLVASVAHEVGNCLTGITGYCQLLTMDPYPETYPSEELQLIEREGRRAVRIVQSVLGMSRQTKLRDEPVDTHAALSHALELLRHYAAKRGVEVSNDISEDTPFVHGDRTQVQQLLINLIKNATDAIEETGKRGRISLAAHAEGRWIRIRIADDGPGIPPEVQSAIFEPFFTTKKDGKGTGLGLSFSRDLAHSFGGDLRLDPDVQQGACFVLELRRWTLDAEEGDDAHPTADAPASEIGAAEAELRKETGTSGCWKRVPHASEAPAPHGRSEPQAF